MEGLGAVVGLGLMEGWGWWGDGADGEMGLKEEGWG